jgi:5'(3')-deoxyribonucleotidase
VLALFDQAILDRWNDRNNTNITRENINVWHMEEVLKDDLFGVPAVELIDRWMVLPDFFENLKPVEGAIDGFNYLCDRFDDVIIASSIGHVYQNIYDGKRRWLEKHLPDFPRDSFIAISRKGLLTADYLLDDGSHNIKEWMDSESGHALVFDAPYNQDIKEGMGCTRVKGWAGVREFFEGLDKIEEILNDSADKHLKRYPFKRRRSALY